MKFSTVLLLWFICLSPTLVVAQLSGTYSVGDTTLDYRNIPDAISDLKLKGVKGSVVLLLKSGTYPSFVIDSIPGIIGSNRLVLKPAQDTAKVLIQGGQNVVTLQKTYNITIKGLSMMALGATDHCFFADVARNCKVENCQFLSPNGRGTFASRDDAAVVIHNNFRGVDSCSILIRNCTFEGKSNSVRVTGYAGVTRFVSCDFGKTGVAPLTTSWSGPVSVDSCTLFGQIEMSWARGGTFIANTFTSSGRSRQLAFARVSGNQFFGTDGVTIAAKTVKNNSFEQDIDLEDVIHVSNNNFKQGVDVSRANYLSFVGNTVLGRADISRCEYSLIESNSFNGDLRSSYCYRLLFINNLIQGTTSMSFADQGKILHNNFNNNVSISAYSGEVYANNIAGTFNVGSSTFVSHNNYYPSYGSNDLYPFHVDPMYKGAQDLEAQNNALIGQAPLLPEAITDFNGTARKGYTSIGAHEICADLKTTKNNIEVPCGTPVRLQFCNAASKGGHHWTPTTDLDDPNSLSPMASPTSNTTYYLLDSGNAVLDSVFIKFEDLDYNGYRVVPVNCGSGAILTGPTHLGAIYSFSPDSALMDINLLSPYANPNRTTEYVKKIEIPGCGTYYDTILIEVTREPQAFGWAVDTLKRVQFQGFVVCPDSIRWDFGDGNTSRKKDPIHEYKNWGSYTATITVYTDSLFAVDTVPVALTSSLQNHPIPAGFSVYPNPSSSGIFQFEKPSTLGITEISLWTADGRKVKELAITSNSFHIEKPKGLYLIQVISNQRAPFYYKVLKQ